MQHIPSIDDFLTRDSVHLADTTLNPCPICGHKHPVPFEAIRIGRGAIQEVPELARSILGRTPRRPILIYDRAIEAIIQAQVIEPLRKAGLPVEPFPMQGEPGHLLELGPHQWQSGGGRYRVERGFTDRGWLGRDQRPDQMDRNSPE